MFKFNKKDDAEPAKKKASESVFDDLLKSMKGSSSTPTSKKPDLRNYGARDSFYKSLSSDDLRKYAKEVDEIVDLLLGAVSIQLDAKKTDRWDAVSKMLFSMAAQRVATLRNCPNALL
jgi:hypothetical protein